MDYHLFSCNPGIPKGIFTHAYKSVRRRMYDTIIVSFSTPVGFIEPIFFIPWFCTTENTFRVRDIMCPCL